VSRVFKPSPPGSLFKSALSPKKKIAFGKKARKIDNEHLSLIRECPCVSCGLDPCGEAAHIRMTSDGRPTGIGRKPDDAKTISLCRTCHTQQHDVGETKFWGQFNPLRVAETLYKLSPNLEGMRAAAFIGYAMMNHKDGK
jgi:hypothetical protein